MKWRYSTVVGANQWKHFWMDRVQMGCQLIHGACVCLFSWRTTSPDRKNVFKFTRSLRSFYVQCKVISIFSIIRKKLKMSIFSCQAGWKSTVPPLHLIVC